MFNTGGLSVIIEENICKLAKPHCIAALLLKQSICNIIFEETVKK
jgi:hypothetical protein